MSLLVARDISKSFGGIVALDRLSLSIDEGEAVGLVGPNGAGKTTLFNCLLGLEHPDTGTVIFDGVPIDHLPMFRRSKLGIGRTFQRLELFAGMTPREHVLVTERVRGGRGRLWKDILGIGRPSAEERRATDGLLELVGLEAEADVPVEALSLGHGRLVELARALVGEPRLLMLDEPSSGLDRAERVELVSILRHVREERGAAFVLVEHDLEMVAAATQRLVVLDFGRLIADGAIESVLENPDVRHAYLGHPPKEPRAPRAERAGAVVRVGSGPGPTPARESPPRPLLELRDVDVSYGPYRALFGVSFSVAERSAVALVGSNGAGKSTVARVVSGLVRPSGGRIVFDGRDVTGWPAWRIARLGVAHAPEGRSVFASLTVEENLALDFRRSFGSRGLAAALRRAYETYPRLGERRDQLAGTLSGGEQRMLALARVLAVPQRLLVVDELSLGLAPVVVDEVFAALRHVLESGTALLIVEQHVERALELADRAVVLSAGRATFEGHITDVRDVASPMLGPLRDLLGP
ncbi:MAG: ATP-binding cassette domain-containing protein [Acidimicrobiales bacterium]